MATETRMLACRICNAVTPHEAQKTSHVLHLLLALVTAGLWLPIWFLLSIGKGKPKCQQCVVALAVYDRQRRG